MTVIIINLVGPVRSHDTNLHITMFIHIYIIFFSLIISSTIQNDVIFYNKLLKEHFFSKAKKSWISYTNKSISVAIQRHMQVQIKTRSVRSSLSMLHRFIKTLLYVTQLTNWKLQDLLVCKDYMEMQFHMMEVFLLLAGSGY